MTIGNKARGALSGAPITPLLQCIDTRSTTNEYHWSEV